MKIKTITVLAGVLFPAIVHAGDVKSHPGYSCVTQNPNVLRGFAGISNLDSAPQPVACPTVRENILEDVDRAVVWVVDNSTVSNFTCTLRMVTEDGVTFDQDVQTSSGVGTQELVFGSLSSADRGYLSLICSIPGVQANALSSIISYRINELP